MMLEKNAKMRDTSYRSPQRQTPLVVIVDSGSSGRLRRLAVVDQSWRLSWKSSMAAKKSIQDSKKGIIFTILEIDVALHVVLLSFCWHR
jgi:hypothetical protein